MISGSNDTIPTFDHIAPSVWEYTPPSVHPIMHSTSSSSSRPSLILLCPWTGAQNRYIAKYAGAYQTLFPSTRIMIITTTAKDLLFRNSERKQSRLKPAVHRISSYKYLNDAGVNNGILMHVFSEGGSNKAVELAEAYRHITSTRLPVSALCMDSTPGHPRYLRLCNALDKALPQVPVLRHTGLFFGSILLGCIWIMYTWVMGIENNVITRTRRRLQDHANFDPKTPRCYLYSSDDALISWQDVNEHVQDTRDQGTPVMNVFFEGSGHVEHARMHHERYWESVLATWNASIVCRVKASLNDGIMNQTDFIVKMPEKVQFYRRLKDNHSQQTLVC